MKGLALCAFLKQRSADIKLFNTTTIFIYLIIYLLGCWGIQAYTGASQ